MVGWLDWFVGTGTALDWILGLVVFEAILLMTYRAITGAGLTAGVTFSLLLPGACLLLALRCALTNGRTVIIAALLLAAFVAHLTDLTLRWRSSGRGGRFAATRW